jgi:hypothetical protein
VLIPDRDPTTGALVRDAAGDVRYRVYPFGIFPSPEYPVRVFRLTTFEVQYPDMSVNYRHRNQTSAEDALTEVEFRAAMAEIRRIRTNGRRFDARSPAIDDAARFSTGHENCTWFVRQVARAAGKTIPVQLRLLDQFQPRAVQALVGLIVRSARATRLAMRLFGHRGDGHLTRSSVITSPYVLRRYLQLRSETEALERAAGVGARSPSAPRSARLSAETGAA